MTTSNIISTPNITGNIGSCTIQSNDVTISTTFWTQDHSVTQINSCTGKIISNNAYTDYTGLQFFGFIGAFILGIFIIEAIATAGNRY
jgi:hypothetical protein